MKSSAKKKISSTAALMKGNHNLAQSIVQSHLNCWKILHKSLFITVCIACFIRWLYIIFMGGPPSRKKVSTMTHVPFITRNLLIFTLGADLLNILNVTYHVYAKKRQKEKKNKQGESSVSMSQKNLNLTQSPSFHKKKAASAHIQQIVHIIFPDFLGICIFYTINNFHLFVFNRFDFSGHIFCGYLAVAMLLNSILTLHLIRVYDRGPLFYIIKVMSFLFTIYIIHTTFFTSFIFHTWLESLTGLLLGFVYSKFLIQKHAISSALARMFVLLTGLGENLLANIITENIKQ